MAYSRRPRSADLWPPIWRCLLVTMIGGGLVIAIWAIHQGNISYDQQRIADRQTYTMHLLDQTSLKAGPRDQSAMAYRKILAAKFLHDSSFDRKTLTINVAQLRQIAATGKPVSLGKPVVVWSWDGFWNQFLFPDVYYALMMWSLLMSLYFIVWFSDSEWKLTDLPRKRVSTWIFLVLSAPLTLPVLGISWIRGHWVEYEIERPRPAYLPRFDEEFDDPDDFRGPRDVELPKAKVTPEESRANWIDLRVKFAHEGRTREITRIHETIDELTHNIKYYGGLIQSSQRELVAPKARLAALQTLSAKSYDEAGKAQLGAEYDRLCILPSVTEVRVQDERVEVICRDVTVDLGDFGLRDLGDYRIVVSAREREMVMVYPLRYVNGLTSPYCNSEGYFCFGSRSNQIAATWNEGEYLAVAALVVEGLLHVNENYRSTVAENYPKPRSVSV